jgi:hypothetical protein
MRPSGGGGGGRGGGTGRILLIACSTCAVSCAFSAFKYATTSASLATSHCAPLYQIVSIYQLLSWLKRNCCSSQRGQPGLPPSGLIWHAPAAARCLKDLMCPR